MIGPKDVDQLKKAVDEWYAASRNCIWFGYDQCTQPPSAGKPCQIRFCPGQYVKK
jgi:hypothetical protein